MLSTFIWYFLLGVSAGWTIHSAVVLWRQRRADRRARLSGEYLARVAENFGLSKLPGESDEALRARLDSFLKNPPGYPKVKPTWAEDP